MIMPSLKPFLIIAVDGGAASGKSSTSRRLAEKFNLLHVDTGSHYRAITAVLLESGLHPDNPGAVTQSLQSLRAATAVNGNSATILLNGRAFDTHELRSEAVNEAVSKIASMSDVRAFLRDYQRNQATIARENNFNGLVMEGRDIGSVIFPDADLAVFLEADATTRASRRASEGIVDTIEERDRLDRGRKEAPLTCPPGALRINTGVNDLDAVVAIISEKIHELSR